MPVQITISASSLKELWAELSAFSQDPQGLSDKTLGNKNWDKTKTTLSEPPGHSPGAVSGNGENPGGNLGAQVASTSSTPAPAPGIKRGPGRPPKNPKPQLVQTQTPEPDNEDPSESPLENQNPDEIRQDITAAVTRHWRENVPEKKALIREFRAAVGIGMMLELQPEDFPKAYQLLRKLEAMGGPTP